MEAINSLIPVLGPYVILAAGVALVIHGHSDSGLVTGAFALIQVASRPTRDKSVVQSDPKQT
ncbi:MAG TPA: hypothetical protein VGF88_23710 [Acidobacteriaceae bacterium]|jgi:hypothetical protein